MRYKGVLAMPGPNWHLSAALAALRHASRDHDFTPMGSPQSCGNFNLCLIEALNLYEAGGIDLLAMMHSDIIPVAVPNGLPENTGFLDVLIQEMESKNAALCSQALPIKDGRGLFSCGILDPNNQWEFWRRFTSQELEGMPETFTAADIGEEARGLFHNHGLMVVDLRDERWRQTNEAGELLAMFDFKARVVRNPEGKWQLQHEGEDIYFSRRVKELGIPSCITRKLLCEHVGPYHFPSRGKWGAWEHDRDTQWKWEAK